MDPPPHQFQQPKEIPQSRSSKCGGDGWNERHTHTHTHFFIFGRLCFCGSNSIINNIIYLDIYFLILIHQLAYSSLT